MDLTSKDRSLTPAILATLDTLNLGPVDDSAAQLALRVAQELDSAAWAERAADKVLQAVIDDGVMEGEELEAVQALRAKLAARVAVSDLGPKLLSVLTEIGATPMSRARIAKLVPAAAKPAQGRERMTSIAGGIGA
jgi:hypothetical protein